MADEISITADVYFEDQTIGLRLTPLRRRLGKDEPAYSILLSLDRLAASTLGRVLVLMAETWTAWEKDAATLSSGVPSACCMTVEVAGELDGLEARQGEKVVQIGGLHEPGQVLREVLRGKTSDG